jgi:hypothetical protein
VPLGTALERGGTMTLAPGWRAITPSYTSSRSKRAVAGEGRDRTGDLVEQRTDLRAIIDIWGSQFGGDDFAGVGVNAEVQLPPGPARPRAMLLDQPFAGTAQSKAGAVHE